MENKTITDNDPRLSNVEALWPGEKIVLFKDTTAEKSKELKNVFTFENNVYLWLEDNYFIVADKEKSYAKLFKVLQIKNLPENISLIADDFHENDFNVDFFSQINESLKQEKPVIKTKTLWSGPEHNISSVDNIHKNYFVVQANNKQFFLEDKPAIFLLEEVGLKNNFKQKTAKQPLIQRLGLLNIPIFVFVLLIIIWFFNAYNFISF